MGETIAPPPAAPTALAPLHVSGGPSPDELAAALAVLAARRAPGEAVEAVAGFAAGWQSVRRRALVPRRCGTE